MKTHLTVQPEGRCLGLIGGLGVGATIHYYRELAKMYAARSQKMRLVIVHADMGRVLETVRRGEPSELAQYLKTLLDSLYAAGAEVAAISAITPHYSAGELESTTPLPLVNALVATDDAISARGFKRVGIFGTRFSIETDLFGQIRSAEIVRPQPAEIDFIHDTYLKIAESHSSSEECARQLSDLAHGLIDRERLDAIILAGTDLSVVFNEDNTDFPHIDCSQVHIEAIMKSLFDDIPRR